MKATNRVRFALDPPKIIGRSARQRRIEHLLMWLAETANVDHDRESAGHGETAHQTPKLPGFFMPEGGEGEFALLASYGGKIFVQVGDHSHPS